MHPINYGTVAFRSADLLVDLEKLHFVREGKQNRQEKAKKYY